MFLQITTASREEVLSELVTAFRARGVKKYAWSTDFDPEYWVGVNGMCVRVADHINSDEFGRVYANSCRLVTGWTEAVSEEGHGYRTKVRFFLGPISNGQPGDKFLVFDWLGSMKGLKSAFHNLADAFVADTKDLRVAVLGEEEVNAFLRPRLWPIDAFDKEKGSRINWLLQSVKQTRRMSRTVYSLCSKESMTINRCEEAVLHLVDGGQLVERLFESWKDAGVGTPFDPDPQKVIRNERVGDRVGVTA